MSMINPVVLGAFIVKHYLGDFPWQTSYMLGKGKGGWSWILPLFAHSSVHAGLSAIIILLYKPELVWIVGLELIAHFMIDKIKVSCKLPQGTWAPEDKGRFLSMYYRAFGLDQSAHYFCYLIMLSYLG